MFSAALEVILPSFFHRFKDYLAMTQSPEVCLWKLPPLLSWILHRSVACFIQRLLSLCAQRGWEWRGEGVEARGDNRMWIMSILVLICIRRDRLAVPSTCIGMKRHLLNDLHHYCPNLDMLVTLLMYAVGSAPWTLLFLFRYVKVFGSQRPTSWTFPRTLSAFIF